MNFFFFFYFELEQIKDKNIQIDKKNKTHYPGARWDAVISKKIILITSSNSDGMRL